MNIVYRGRKAHPAGEWRDGIRLDFVGRSRTLQLVSWTDPDLNVDPTDDEWFAAEPVTKPRRRSR